MGLLSPALNVSGSVQLNGVELTDLSETTWRGIRGKEIGMIFLMGRDLEVGGIKNFFQK
jgi:ABC-type microcin C transport system duplicated ATPase subunit YejF